MYYTYAHLSESGAFADAAALHGTADVYNTGHILASTGCATRYVHSNYIWNFVKKT